MRIVFVIVLFFVSLVTYAHSDLKISVNKGNIHFEYRESWRQFEYGQKFNILLDRVEKLVKVKGYSSQQLYFYFDHDYTKRDSAYIAVGYGPFSYLDYDATKSSTVVNETGLIIIIRDEDCDIKQMLNLINSALANVDFIKANSQPLIIDKHASVNGVAQFDMLSSISSTQVEEYLSSSDSITEQLLDEKTYRYLKQSEETGAIDYYYLNNKFHLYYLREPDKKWSQELGKYVDSLTYKADILVVDNILEMFGSDDDGHFIFTNDSVFYYIPEHNDKVQGPFEVEGVIAGRPPVYNYYRDYGPLRKFVLYFDNYHSLSKALFIPDSNVVISNFGTVENELIQEILSKENVNQPEEESKANQYLIWTLLLLSIMLNLGLWVRKRK